MVFLSLTFQRSKMCQKTRMLFKFNVPALKDVSENQNVFFKFNVPELKDVSENQNVFFKFNIPELKDVSENQNVFFLSLTSQRSKMCQKTRIFFKVQFKFNVPETSENQNFCFDVLPLQDTIEQYDGLSFEISSKFCPL